MHLIVNYCADYVLSFNFLVFFCTEHIARFLNGIKQFNGRYLDFLLDEPLPEFLELTSLSSQQIAERLLVIQEVEEILFEFGRVHAFGSFVTGIGDGNSDVDLYFLAYRECHYNFLLFLPLSSKTWTSCKNVTCILMEISCHFMSQIDGSLVQIDTEL